MFLVSSQCKIELLMNDIWGKKNLLMNFERHTKGTVNLSWCSNSVIPSGNWAIWKVKDKDGSILINFILQRSSHGILCNCVMQAKSETLMPYFRHKGKKYCNLDMMMPYLISVKDCSSNKQQVSFLLLPQKNKTETKTRKTSQSTIKQ